jgi:3-hydroxy acid dehydrogenase/malonic semialdehyde reductase
VNGSFVAVVTGASSGIGAEICQSLLARGCSVVMAGRVVSKFAGLAASFAGRALPVEIDLVNHESIASTIQALPQPWRDIDVVINCAGHAPGGRQRFDLRSLGHSLQTIDTNLMGVLSMCHAALPGMISRGRGHVVNVGSVAGAAPYANDAAYIASKFGLRGLTEALRLDLAGTGVRVTEVRPSVTKTLFAKTRYGDDSEAAAGFYERMGSVLQPADVAACVLFALDAPAHVNVSEVVVHPLNGKSSF